MLLKTHAFGFNFDTMLTRAASQGLEPQLTAPEAVVLPLDELALFNFLFQNLFTFCCLVHSFSKESVMFVFKHFRKD